MKTKHTKIPIDFLNIDIYVFRKKKHYTKAIKQINGTHSTLINGICELIELDNGVKIIFIGVFDKKLSTLVHEIVHATTNLTEIYKIKDEETIAYLSGFIFENSRKFIERSS